MKKVIRLTESDLTHIVRRVVKEQKEQVGDSFHDDTESVFIQIMGILSPVYKKYGTEGVVTLLTDIIGTIDDIGDEAFMGPEDY